MPRSDSAIGRRAHGDEEPEIAAELEDRPSIEAAVELEPKPPVDAERSSMVFDASKGGYYVSGLGGSDRT
jgi:hypothetical protein